MSTLRRAAATATDLACLAAGRRPVVRAARFILGRARLDVPNDLHFNGESSLQRWVLDMSPPGRDLHVIDVGANVGRWSVAMLTAAQEAGRSGDLDLHAFEPSAYMFERLEATLHGRAGEPAANGSQRHGWIFSPARVGAGRRNELTPRAARRVSQRPGRGSDHHDAGLVCRACRAGTAHAGQNRHRGP